jgi:chromosome segregation ATPase
MDEKKTIALEQLLQLVNSNFQRIFNVLLPNSKAQIEKVN